MEWWFFLFVCLVFILFILTFHSSCAFMTPFGEPWRSSLFVFCLSAPIPRLAVLLIIDDSSKRPLSKKGSFSNLHFLSFSFSLKKIHPFLPLSDRAEYSFLYMSSLQFYMKNFEIPWFFLNTGQNHNYFFIELPWCRLIFLLFLFFFVHLLLDYFVLILFKYFF